MRFLLTVFILLSVPACFAQILTLTGYLKSATDSSALPLGLVQLLTMNDAILGEAQTDEDGRYYLKIDLLKPDFYQLNAKYACYIDRTVKINNSNLTSINKDIFLQPVSCKETSILSCPQFSDSCSVIKIIYLFPRSILSRKGKKAQKRGEVIYKELKMDLTDCCLNKWYCKTHKNEY